MSKLKPLEWNKEQRDAYSDLQTISSKKFMQAKHDAWESHGRLYEDLIDKARGEFEVDRQKNQAQIRREYPDKSTEQEDGS